MNKRNIFSIILIVWTVLWIVFLVREDKDGQYRTLGYLYAHTPQEGMQHLMGDKLYSFIRYCKENIPPDATYQMFGFEDFSIDEVRARYFLWPRKRVEEGADFEVVYGDNPRVIPVEKEVR